MNNKTSLFVLGIALLGVLVYVLSSTMQPDMPPVISDKTASPESVSPSATSLQEQRLSPREPDTFSRDEAITSPVATQEQQQAPALEPEIREALGNILNTSSEDLVEETSNGVTRVNLQGRFQTAPVATINEQGEARIVDYSSVPEEYPQ